MPFDVNTMAGPRRLTDEEMAQMPPELRQTSGVYQPPSAWEQAVMRTGGGQPGAGQPNPLLQTQNKLTAAIQGGLGQSPEDMARKIQSFAPRPISPSEAGIPMYNEGITDLATAVRGGGLFTREVNPEYGRALASYNAAISGQVNPLASALGGQGHLLGMAGGQLADQAKIGLAGQRQQYEIGGRATWDKTLQDMQAKGASEDEIARAHQIQGQYGVPNIGGQMAAGGQPSAARSPSGGAPLPPGKVADILKANPGAKGMDQAISQIYSQLGPEQIMAQRASILPALETAYGAGSLTNRVTSSGAGKLVRALPAALGGIFPGAPSNWYTPEGRANLRGNFQIPLSESIDRALSPAPSRASEENALIRQLLGHQ